MDWLSEKQFSHGLLLIRKVYSVPRMCGAMSNSSLWKLVLLFVGCTSCGLGCASAPYRYGHFHDVGCTDEAPGEVQFEYGRPNKFLDRMAWAVGWPTRILPMSPNVNDHKFSEETSAKLTAYMEENDITDVLVRVNQYDPLGEWRRLRQNKQISAGWRYTFGTVGLINYTLFPGRVFGGDFYNPFTNSLYVNSDLPAVLIVEAAYAKDLHGRKLPGAYAAVNELPVLTLWRYSHGVSDTLSYARLKDDWEVERETYRVVYPLLGIQVALGGQSAMSMATPLPMLSVPITAIGGAVAGHTFGQSKIARRERERANEPPQDSSDPDAPGVEHVLGSVFDDPGIQLTGFAEPVNADFDAFDAVNQPTVVRGQR